ncbi:iron complex outermembrane recepter protein [Mucilaginibacter mallensis]|uniref:Iron complex outermembrane recepter protein n=1 Tax=Mucilaginibacter mallensis TaxID=652787 RepID=A0A1H2C914_MUCMA|nr:TonB-dependent receptor [Mucilaginibacter mallensis]SDT66933.1 iron complex outermembrane recepter protein [Mucilaginibacter mallensis]
MIKFYATLLLVLLFSGALFAQKNTDSLKKDSTRQLNQVTVRGYLSEQKVLAVPASVSVLTPAQLKLQPDNSLVSAMNTVPGVRMEERSPGSYRLSIRGSLLRSPFGIRDVKIYFDEIPLTDAGGNTYLNAIDVNSVQGIEILKGPDGSLFGANSGGVVLISPVNRYADSSFISAAVDGGSYSLLHESFAFQDHNANNQLNINQAYETYGGYRQNSSMYRNYFQAVDRWKISTADNLKILAFYSDLFYKTPGGLTLSQMEADPRSARLPTKTIPGAIEQKIAIGTKMLMGGLVNEAHITDNIRNVLSVYGSYVNFYNPFITNYEQRYEGTFGMRTYFELTGQQHPNYSWKANVGLEWQQTNSDINNYGNNMGTRDTAQTLDKINTNQHFFFARYSADFYKRLHVEAAMSLNFYDYKFRNVYPNDEPDFTNRPFTAQLMPRLALSYQITNNFAWRASVSRGYSTPTTAEIRPTDNVINTSLQAEYGWNYETGFRLRNDDESMFLDASVFLYKLQNAIILHINPNETETYLNSGGTNQPGFELYFTDWLIRQNDDSFIRGLQLNESVTLDKFTFSTTHNQLTGVPQQVLISSLQVRFPQSLYFFIQHNYTSRLPLNDGNTVFAPHYNLLEAKIGWQHLFSHKTKFEIYGGVDNILNENYSLGDDLNAVGNRYYNPAPPRNYYVGIKVTI